MNQHQRTAIENHCRFGFETAHPRFAYLAPGGKVSIVLSVNSGYECLEMGLGGPVWHASAAGVGRRPHKLDLKAAVQVALAGVGDKERGEWWEWTGYAMHLRRRLSAEEQAMVGDVIDCRGTEEWQRRLDAMEVLAALRPTVMRLAEEERCRPST